MLAVGEQTLADWDPKYVQLGTGLAGGVAGTRQEMCGALSGGVLVIGGLMGREGASEDDWPALDLATRYRERFQAEFGVTQCARLREVVHAPGGLGSCALLVERAATILLEMLGKAGQGV